MASDDPDHPGPAKDDASTSGPAAAAPDETFAPGTRRRRPPATLDLPATDVTPAEAAPAGASPEPPVETPSEIPSEAPSAAAPEAAEAGAAPDSVAEDAPPAEPAAQPSAAPPPRRAPGLIATVVIGLIAGLIGGAAGFVVTGSYLAPSDTADELTEIETNLVELRQRLAAVDQRVSAAPSAAPAAAAPAAVSDLADRVTELEKRVVALGATPSAAPALDPVIAELGQKFDGLDGRVSELADAVDKLEKAPAAAAELPPDVIARLSAIEAAATAAKAAAERPVVSPDAVAALSGRVGGLEKRADSLAAALAGADRGVGQLAALGALQEAIVRGKPFTAELAAARSQLGAKGDALAPFEAVAAQGLPTGRALAIRLATSVVPPPAPKPEAAPEPAGAGILDRLKRSAESLVTVRSTEPPGPPPAESAAAHLSRAQAALRAGNAAMALAALNALPPDARAAAAPVVTAIETRRDAIAAIDQLRRDVLLALAGRAP